MTEAKSLVTLRSSTGAIHDTNSQRVDCNLQGDKCTTDAGAVCDLRRTAIRLVSAVDRRRNKVASWRTPEPVHCSHQTLRLPTWVLRRDEEFARYACQARKTYRRRRSEGEDRRRRSLVWYPRYRAGKNDWIRCQRRRHSVVLGG